MQYPIGLTCHELVDLVTDYLEDALDPEVRARFELHLSVCAGCVDYLEQMRHTIGAMAQLREESLEPTMRDELLRAFRTWRDSAS
jgi:anti-sigma factor RsiW